MDNSTLNWLHELALDYSQNVPIAFCESLRKLHTLPPTICFQREVSSLLFSQKWPWAARPPNPKYKRAFLKKIINWVDAGVLDGSTDEFDDQIVNEYIKSDVASSEFTFKSFVICGPQLQIKSVVTCMEHCAIISQATTGLRTWSASLRLAEYFWVNPDILAGKNVLELGSGAGFLLNFIANNFRVSGITGTDSNAHVLDILAKNVELNSCNRQSEAPIPRIQHLTWGKLQACSNLLTSDIVLGADVAYDPDLISPLLDTLEYLLGSPLSNVKWVYLSFTVRDQQTFEAFLQKCKFKIQFIDTSNVAELFYHSESVNQSKILLLTSSADLKVY